MATYMDMTFTGTLNTAVAGLAPDTGGGAFSEDASGAGALKLDGNGTVYKTTASGSPIAKIFWNQTVPTADYQLDFLLDVKSILASDAGSIAYRLVDGNNFYNCFVLQDGTVKLQKVVAGVSTDLGTATVTLTAGTTPKFSVRGIGNQLWVLWNDIVVVGPITDSTYTAAGKPGARVGSSTGVAHTTTTGIHGTRLTAVDSVTSPPVNTVAPVITTDGSPSTGETISCNTGTWSNTPTGYTYQWQRDTSVAQDGSGFTNISGATSSSYLLALADEGKGVRCRVTATNAAGSATASSNTITPPVTSPLAASDIHFRLSGGASNTNPANSYGGAESSTDIGSDLLDAVLFSEAIAGATEYRLVYVHNIHSVFNAGVKAWIDQQLANGLILALGVAVETAGATVAQPASSTTAPAGVTFTSPTTSGAAIDLGTIPHGSFRGLWIQRFVPALSSQAAHNLWHVSTDVTQL